MAKYIRANALATKTNLEDVAFGGNVGIGTTDPRAKLAVIGNAFFGGNVGIGTKGPDAKIDIHGDPAAHPVADIILRFMPAADAHMRLLADSDFGSVEVAGDRAFRVATNDRVRLAVDGSGNVGIGTTEPAATLDVAGPIIATGINAEHVHSASDARFKTNVTPVANALDKLEELRAVSFQWNELYESLGRSTGQRREIGLVAQDVEAVFPELVSTWGDEGYKV